MASSSLNLSPFAGSQNLRLRFEFATGGTFNTGSPLTGGVEISAVAAYDLTDGQTIQLQSFDMGTPVPTTFEFDFGLVLNLPGGPAYLPALPSPRLLGLSISARQPVQTTWYTQRRTQLHKSPKSFQLQLQARGINVTSMRCGPNVLILPTGGLFVPGTYSFTGLLNSNVIQGTPGVAGTNVSIPVRADALPTMTLRQSLFATHANCFRQYLVQW